MNKGMIFATLRDTETGEEVSGVYTYDEYHTATFSPIIDTVCLFDFSVKGKTYAERKEALKQKAIDYSLNTAPGLSWGECAILSEFFRHFGARYGLLREFRENAIC